MELEKLSGIIAAVLGMDKDDITLKSSLIDDLGADSLDIYRIFTNIEEEFDIELSQAEIEKIKTVAQVVEKVKTAIN